MEFNKNDYNLYNFVEFETVLIRNIKQYISVSKDDINTLYYGYQIKKLISLIEKRLYSPDSDNLTSFNFYVTDTNKYEIQTKLYHHLENINLMSDSLFVTSELYYLCFDNYMIKNRIELKKVYSGNNYNSTFAGRKIMFKLNIFNTDQEIRRYLENKNTCEIGMNLFVIQVLKELIKHYKSNNPKNHDKRTIEDSF